MRELKRQGVNTSEPIDAGVYDDARLAVRPVHEQLRDGTKMLAGRVNKTMGWYQVPVEVGRANLKVCRGNKCGSYGYKNDFKRLFGKK